MFDPEKMDMPGSQSLKRLKSLPAGVMGEKVHLVPIGVWAPWHRNKLNGEMKFPQVLDLEAGPPSTS